MAVRRQTVKEYIGARYVPLFYDDGNGGAECVSGIVGSQRPAHKDTGG